LRTEVRVTFKFNKMSKKYYAIRQIAYHYNDEYLYSVGLGGIESVFEDKEMATKKHLKLELARLRTSAIGDMEQTSSCAQSQEKLEEADAFFRKNFNKPLFTESGEHRYVDMYEGFPKDATDEQILAFAKLTGIKFFELAEFENEPVFWMLRRRLKNGNYEAEFTHLNIPEGLQFWEYGDEVGVPPDFYNSYEAALQQILSEYNRHYAPKKAGLASGNLDELTDQPDLLLHFIETAPNIVFENNELAKTDDISLEELNSAYQTFVGAKYSAWAL
jgi:hypothetical protein